jgi:hypothetical protein
MRPRPDDADQAHPPPRPEPVEELSAELLTLAVERTVLRSRRLRVDTTVVESDSRYPTDSALGCSGSPSGLASAPLGASQSGELRPPVAINLRPGWSTFQPAMLDQFSLGLDRRDHFRPQPSAASHPQLTLIRQESLDQQGSPRRLGAPGLLKADDLEERTGPPMRHRHHPNGIKRRWRSRIRGSSNRCWVFASHRCTSLSGELRGSVRRCAGPSQPSRRARCGQSTSHTSSLRNGFLPCFRNSSSTSRSVSNAVS